ncbi:MAG: hypothetical protein KatS3mg008_1749 [Acidimicrobiales bacterium]|nr:MAG: hypothetical protein KatS3mg008_1749 [Acidimicrobiales bacterium]
MSGAVDQTAPPVSSRARPGGDARRTLGGDTRRPHPDESAKSGLHSTVDAVELLALAGLWGVFVCLVVSFATATAGLHDGRAVLAISSAVWLASGALALRGFRAPILDKRLHIVVDRRTVASTIVLAALSAWMFLPGFPYAAGDKDPGIYVVHAVAIAREGSLTLEDPIQEAEHGDGLPVAYYLPGSRFPGLWVDELDPTRIRPQFFHGYPALAATFADVVGIRGVFHLNPLLAVGVVVSASLLGRRLVGRMVGVLAGVFLATNMVQVWQAKYPSSEIPAQLLATGALLAGVVAVDTRWRHAAYLAGACAGATFLVRPDGVLVVAAVVVVVAACRALRWADDLLPALSVGLATPLPLAFWQAYVTNTHYSEANSVPPFAAVVAGAAIVFAAGELVRRFGARPVGWLLSVAREDRVPARLVRSAAAVSFVGALVLLWYRQRLLGVAYFLRNDELIRSYDEQALRRLAMFLTRPGVLAMAAGGAIVLARRWQARVMLAVVPGSALLFLYLWAGRISPQMMWYVRRWVPYVLVTVMLLVAVAAGRLLRGGGLAAPFARVAGVALVVYLTGVFLHQSLPLREHHEFAGSYDLVRDVAALAGDEPALFLWQYPDRSDIFDESRTFAGPLFALTGTPSAYLPDPAVTDPDVYVDEYARRFPDRRLFVVTKLGREPESLDTSRLEEVTVIHREMPVWEESNAERPDRTSAEEGRPLFMSVRVWQLEG